MTYNYSLHQEAFEEYTKALSWYQESGREPQYREAIKHAINAIRGNPFAWQKEELDNRFRRYVVQRFPYKVIYAINSEKHHIYIIAIASTYRKPDYWQERTE